jgi:hypothetical protein
VAFAACQRVLHLDWNLDYVAASALGCQHGTIRSVRVLPVV